MISSERTTSSLPLKSSLILCLKLPRNYVVPSSLSGVVNIQPRPCNSVDDA
ncbi:unnamed protein product [Brassica rapa subsp. trilocularis]